MRFWEILCLGEAKQTLDESGKLKIFWEMENKRSLKD